MDSTFPQPALPRRFSPRRFDRISEGQARRLYARAMEAGHTRESYRRLLRFHGYDDDRRITKGDYDALCEMAGRADCASMWMQPLPIETETPLFKGTLRERPHVAHASKDDYDMAWSYATASDEILLRQARRIHHEIEHLGPQVYGTATAETLLRRSGHDLRLVLTELTWRLACQREALAQAPPSGDGAQTVEPMPP